MALSDQEIIILRHAKSDWSGAVAADFDRPLNARGWQEPPRIGHWLLHHDCRPDYLVSSPAVRAAQTVELVAASCHIATTEIVWQPAIYNATQEALLNVLKGCPADRQRILLVGHNPGLENLLEFLLPTPLPQSTKSKALPTATLVRLRMQPNWRKHPENSGQLLDWVQASDLPEAEPATAIGP